MKHLLKKLLLAVFAIFLFSACATDKYNVSDLDKIEDVHENNPYVYGDPDGPPRQLANGYEDTEEAAEASKRIYDKFFVEHSIEGSSTDSTSTDSTVVVEEEPETTGATDSLHKENVGA